MVVLFKHCPRKRDREKLQTSSPSPSPSAHSLQQQPLPRLLQQQLQQQFWAAQDHMLRFLLGLFKHKGMLLSTKQLSYS